MTMTTTTLHPRLDIGITDYPEVKDFAGGTLNCLCESNKVEVKIDSQTFTTMHVVVLSVGNQKVPIFL